MSAAETKNPGIAGAIAAERRDLAAILAGLPRRRGTPQRCARAGGYAKSWRTSPCRSGTGPRGSRSK